MIRFLRRFARRLIYGKPSLKKHEQFVLDRLREALPEAERAVVEIQLKNLEIVQRSPGNRLTAMFFGKEIPLLPNQGSEHCLAQLKILCGGRSVTVAVISHRGSLSSIEFHGSPDRISNGDLKLKELILNAQDRGVSCAIDRLEHGEKDAQPGH